MRKEKKRGGPGHAYRILAMFLFPINKRSMVDMAIRIVDTYKADLQDDRDDAQLSLGTLFVLLLK